MTYSEKLKDPRWQKKRLEILERDEFTCQNCLSKDKNLQVHHWKYGKQPWDVQEELLITLCEECHKKAKSIFDEIIIEIAEVCTLGNDSGAVTKLEKMLQEIRAFRLSKHSVGIDPVLARSLIGELVDGAYWFGESVGRKQCGRNG